MNGLRLFAEQTLQGLGLEGAWLQVASHITLVLLTALIAWVAYMVCYKLVAPAVMRIARRTEARWDDIICNPKTMRAACRIVPAVVAWRLAPDVFHAYPAVEYWLSRAAAVYITVMATLMCLALVNAFKDYEHSQHETLHQYYNTFCGALKIIVVFISIIIVVAIVVNRSPATLMAGLGATSAVLMLVFKDTISGLVAGIRLTSNDMLRVGDWITVDKAGINGYVESITMTTVKVRNFDNTTLTVSPLTLVNDSFQNWTSMKQGDGRRVKRRVYFDFRSIRVADEQTLRVIEERYGVKPRREEKGAVNMTLFRRYAESYLARRPDVVHITKKRMHLMVRQLEATETGLPVEFYFFVREKEWVPYEHRLADIMEHFYAAAPDFGLRIYQRVSDD